MPSSTCKCAIELTEKLAHCFMSIARELHGSPCPDHQEVVVQISSIRQVCKYKICKVYALNTFYVLFTILVPYTHRNKHPFWLQHNHIAFISTHTNIGTLHEKVYPLPCKQVNLLIRLFECSGYFHRCNQAIDTGWKTKFRQYLLIKHPGIIANLSQIGRFQAHYFGGWQLAMIN